MITTVLLRLCISMVAAGLLGWGLAVLEPLPAAAAGSGSLGVGMADALRGATTGGGQSMTTAEHVREAAWWPTRTTADRAEFVGDAACAECHAGLVRSQAGSQMAHTLMRPAESGVLHQQAKATYASGGYQSSFGQSAAGATVVVTDGHAERQALIEWAFGSGDVGQSYLLKSAEGAEESRFNYFASVDGLAATPGRLRGEPVSLTMALGRLLSRTEERSCFSCHVTGLTEASVGANGAVAPESFVAGVHCEGCHGPGAAHVAAVRVAGGAIGAATWDAKILNPARLEPAVAVETCGACHSTPWDVRVMGAVGVQTVRFPAYRLEQSRCWGARGDVRLECSGCHDPHAPLERNDVAYDATCLSCHAAKSAGGVKAKHTASVETQAAATRVAEAPGKACPVATSRCVSCHMPKVQLPEMHANFTDHRIRIARAAEAFPD